MKNLVLLSLLLIAQFITAQNVGIGTLSPDPSAALDISSTNQGLLIPRVDTTAIAEPTAGLMTFSPSDNGFYFYNGVHWQLLGTVNGMTDSDGDTRVEVEQSSDEDKIRFITGGQEDFFIHDGRIDMPETRTNVILGHDAGATTTGGFNVLIGRDAGANGSTMQQNVFIGHRAGFQNQSATANTFVGDQSGFNNTIGFSNTFIGKDAGWENKSGNGNVAIGFAALRQDTVGFQNVAIGNSAGYFNQENYNTFVGDRAGLNNNAGGSTIIGYRAGQDNSGFGNTYMGYQSGRLNTGLGNVLIGYESGANETNSQNVFIGESAGRYSSSSQSVLIGNRAGYESSGSNNILVGNSSGRNITTGGSNILIGSLTGFRDTSSMDNIMIGRSAGFGFSGSNLTKSRNIFIGTEAGFNNRGDANIFIGYKSGYFEEGNDKLYIDNSDATLPLIYGDFAQDSVIINGTLSINSAYALPFSDGNINEVMTTDGNGNLSWTSTEDDDWTLNSNGYFNFSSRFGIGVINPASNRRFTVSTSSEAQTAYFRNSANSGSIASYGLFSDNYNSGSGDKHGVYGYASSAGTGNKIGVFGQAFSSATSQGYGGYFDTFGSDGIGIYANGSSLAAQFAADVYVEQSIGVGIAEPTYDIHLENNIGNFSSQEVHLGFTNSETGSSVNDGFEISYIPEQNGIIEASHARIWNHEDNGEIRFGTENTQRLVIDKDGQIGIGTAIGVDSKIHIHKASSGDVPAKIRFTDNITGIGSPVTVEGFEVGLGTDQQGVILHTDPKNIEFYIDNLTKVFTLEPDGDVLMGLNGNSDQLRMDQGSVRLVNLGSSNDDNGFKWAEDGSNAFGFVYDGAGSGSSNKLNLREYIGTQSDIMTIEAGGDIGINNVNPGFDLHMGNNSAAKPASSSWSVTSDARSKNVLGAFTDGLQTILDIETIHYEYNGKYGLPKGMKAIGTVAQDLQEVAPYMVSESLYTSEDGSEESFLSVDYGAMDFVLINAIKELKQLVDLQEKRIKQLEVQLSK